MAAYQQDSSFFVEDDCQQYQRIDAKDAARLMARQRQDMISCELSRLDSDEYLEDMMQHMRQLEDEMLPDANLIDMQREIQWYMRPFLIDFIIEAHAAFDLLPETLFLATNLLDRYCSKRVVYKQHYQLVGCAALLIASKYGDKKERVPQISELNNMCCGLYDAGMFTQMEMHVLNTLDWSIGFPTVDVFMQLIVANEQDEKKVEYLASYMCEIALYHRDFVSTKPSVMARASLALARTVLSRPEVMDGEWDAADNMTRLSLSQALHQPSSTLARKYSSTKYHNVSGALKDFLEEQVALAARRAAAAQQAAVQHQPPTPPSEPINKHHSSIYSTPHKPGRAVPGVVDGYLTPPITPEGQCFTGQQDPRSASSHYNPPRCPVTPSPPNVQQHPGYVHPTSHTGFVHHEQTKYFMPVHQVLRQESYPTQMDMSFDCTN
ncbi:G1/S-specific cyclin CLN1 [Zalerion maritima]|uniref:G1/S-specific cyclin CLN1 n=1 Tax=Zalerion maritima TaxID=339359 RepID=A0AAD5WUW9_9PEZI|nr:G1/S-specific cyclin CLN1 [Zalerion maritima]